MKSWYHSLFYTRKNTGTEQWRPAARWCCQPFCVIGPFRHAALCSLLFASLRLLAASCCRPGRTWPVCTEIKYKDRRVMHNCFLDWGSRSCWFVPAATSSENLSVWSG